MARYSGIYLNLQGTTEELDYLQQPRETAWDTISGMLRYKDASGNIHYINDLTLQGTTEELDYLQQPRETAWDTISGMLRYKDASGNINYINDLTLEGTTTELNSLQQQRETAWDTTSGMLRYKDTSDNIHYITSGVNYWQLDPYNGRSGLWADALGFNYTVRLAGTDDTGIYLKWMDPNRGGLFSHDYLIVSGDTLDLSSYNMKLETLSGNMSLRTFNGGNIILKSSGVSTDIKLEATGDVYSTPWIDYTTSATISGWSSLSASGIYYKTIGKLVFIQYEVRGTGNGNFTFISLPYVNNGLFMTTVGVDSTASQYFTAEVSPGGANGIAWLRLGADLVWNNGVLKNAIGSFWYER
jgi:hypothetical protein